VRLFERCLTARRDDYQGRLLRVEAEVARTRRDHKSGRRHQLIRLAALYRDMLAVLDRHDARAP
jgi:hypothetical protein